MVRTIAMPFSSPEPPVPISQWRYQPLDIFGNKTSVQLVKVQEVSFPCVKFPPDKRDSGDENSAMLSRTFFKMTGSLDTNIGKCAEIRRVFHDGGDHLRDQGRAVRKPVNAYLGLKVNRSMGSLRLFKLKPEG